jgi:hypothetical protein
MWGHLAEQNERSLENAPSAFEEAMTGLTDRSIHALKASDKPRRAFDAGGLLWGHLQTV